MVGAQIDKESKSGKKKFFFVCFLFGQIYKATSSEFFRLIDKESKSDRAPDKQRICVNTQFNN